MSHFVTRSQVSAFHNGREFSSGVSIRNETRSRPWNVNHRLRIRPTLLGTLSHQRDGERIPRLRGFRRWLKYALKPVFPFRTVLPIPVRGRRAEFHLGRFQFMLT